MYPQASTGSSLRSGLLQLGFQSLKGELFLRFVHHQGKKTDHFAFSYWFVPWDRFTKILGRFGAHFDTVLLFFERKTIGNCPLGFLGIILHSVLIFWYKRVSKLLLGKNLREG